MKAAAEILLVDDQPFFAPASTDIVDGLIAEYRSTRHRVEQVAALFTGTNSSVLKYFLEGNRCGERRNDTHSVASLFELDGAIAALNASFWSRAFELANIFDVMPQKRRDAWYEQISALQTPDFDEDTVRATLQDLLGSRSQFFAERVDGIFSALSRNHVTNCPQGFSKRMIIENATDKFGGAQHHVCGHINDLRCVVAKFMGRDEPFWNQSAKTVRMARATPGEWVVVDGGAIRIRVYKAGTAHLEIHPDMAWRLNAVLASLYPLAIPASFRTRPKHRAPTKEFGLLQTPLPFAVLNVITDVAESSKPAVMRYHLPYRNDTNKGAIDQAVAVLTALGAVVDSKFGSVRFDYDPTRVLTELLCSGCVPEQKSHQYFPTPENLAAMAVELAQIEDTGHYLEPEAGMGAIARLLPKERTTCVEVSALHCEVLKAQGFNVVAGDFLKWTLDKGRVFDGVVMNPPFSEGRWQLHVAAAEQVLKLTGRLVAILPATTKGKDVLPGWQCEWHGPFANEFDGTGVSVVIMVASKSK